MRVTSSYEERTLFFFVPIGITYCKNEVKPPTRSRVILRGRDYCNHERALLYRSSFDQLKVVGVSLPRRWRAAPGSIAIIYDTDVMSSVMKHLVYSRELKGGMRP